MDKNVQNVIGKSSKHPLAGKCKGFGRGEVKCFMLFLEVGNLEYVLQYLLLLKMC